MYKRQGFDCPGCAWGDNKQGAFRFCENGAKAVAWESTGKTVGADFFAEHSVRRLATQSDYWLEYQGRLTEPLRYNPATDHYEPVSWDQAFAPVSYTHLDVYKRQGPLPAGARPLGEGENG